MRSRSEKGGRGCRTIQRLFCCGWFGLFCVIINNTAAAQKTDQAPPESGRVFHTVLPAVGRKPPSMKREDSFHRAHALHPRTHRARRILQ